MSSAFIVLVLVSFQALCHGAPSRVSFPQLRRFPWQVPREDYQVARRGVNQHTCLQAMNAKRALHVGTPMLSWDAGLAQHAQTWANHLAQKGYMEHAKGTGEGENLYEIWTTTRADATCQDAVDAWYDEIKDYDFSDPHFAGNTGHFTQLVWKHTTKVGAAAATSATPDAEGFYTSFIVARYNPPGNYMGQFAAEVEPLKGKR